MRKIVVEYDSKLLNRRESFNVLVPDKFSDETIILYLLHGLQGCKDDWITYGNAWSVCDKYHTIIVMPTAYNSWYMNQVGNYPYYDYIAKEVWQTFEDTFHYEFPKMVAGCSMGGYGAMKVGIKEHQFIGAASFSGTLDMKKRISLNNGNLKELDIKSFGDDDNVLELIKDRHLEYIYLYCGSADFLYPMTYDNIELFKSHATNFEVSLDDGNHSWKTWAIKLDEMLAWITKTMKEKNK